MVKHVLKLKQILARSALAIDACDQFMKFINLFTDLLLGFLRQIVVVDGDVFSNRCYEVLVKVTARVVLVNF